MVHMENATLITLLRSPSSVFSFKEIFLASGETNPSLLKRRLHYYVKKRELYQFGEDYTQKIKTMID